MIVKCGCMMDSERIEIELFKSKFFSDKKRRMQKGLHPPEIFKLELITLSQIKVA